MGREKLSGLAAAEQCVQISGHTHHVLAARIHAFEVWLSPTTAASWLHMYHTIKGAMEKGYSTKSEALSVPLPYDIIQRGEAINSMR